RGDFFLSSRRRHTRFSRDWSSDVCSSDLCGHTTNEKLCIICSWFPTPLISNDSGEPTCQCGGQITRWYFQFSRIDRCHRANQICPFLFTKRHDNGFLYLRCGGMEFYVDNRTSVNRHNLALISDEAENQYSFVIGYIQNVFAINIGRYNFIKVPNGNSNPWQGATCRVCNRSTHFSGLQIHLIERVVKYSFCATTFVFSS